MDEKQETPKREFEGPPATVQPLADVACGDEQIKAKQAKIRATKKTAGKP